MLKQKLSRKITFLVILILLLVISAMVLFSYHFFKNFYKEHLAREVNEELRAYVTMIESGIDEEIVSYFVIEKNRDRHAHMVYFSRDFDFIYSSHPMNEEWTNQYKSWIKSQYEAGSETLAYVDTGIDFHIPHIWAYQPIYLEGVLTGFFFIDKDTGEFEKAKVQLIWLLVSMGVFSLIIGIILTLYLTKVISMPLIKIGETTREIAKGDFDTRLTIDSKDEVGRLAEDIRIMTKQLKDYRDSKRQFITHISHDLRTPITYIKGYSAIMKDAPMLDEKECRRNLEVIYNEAKRMEYLVSDLFQLTKLEEGKIVLHKEFVNILPWLESIVATRQLMLDNMSIQCNVTATSKDLVVHIDHQRLGQAVINILENSIRYTPKGGSITLDVSEQNEQVVIEIKDTGIGMSEEELPYIWDRFYRVDKSRSRESGGSGLGLAIVKEIVEVHGGTVDVKSEEGLGTSFYINIPKGRGPY